MAYNQNYKAEIKNVEGKLVTIKIMDKLSGDPNTYNLAYTVVDNGNGTITVTFTFDPLPADATSTAIGWSADNGANWSSSTGGTTSPRSITIPSAVYIYLFEVHRPGGNEVFYFPIIGNWDDLVPGGDPCHLRTNNNDENKLAPIQGLELLMQFNAQDNNLLNQLLRGTYSDKRYYVTADIEGRYIFKGYLNLPDTQEPFMPRPVINFTATDGLGSLKTKMLKDFTPANPTGMHYIIEFFAWALKLTGVEENFNVVMNIRGEEYGSILSEPSNHLFNRFGLDAKIFETEIGECDNAYAAMEKLCKYLGRLGQRHGEWWFKNFDEYDTQPDNVCVFDSTGTFVSTYTSSFNKEVGNTTGNVKDMKWSGHNARVGFSSPAKFGKLIYRYENPKELPCNIDFERGTFIADIDANSKKFDLECWTKLYKDGTGDHAAAANMYLRKDYINGFENNRYLVHEDNGVFNFWMSEEIEVQAKDKFTLNVNRRMESNHGTGGTDRCVQVRLYGDDGSFWTHHGKENADQNAYWTSCDSIFSTNQKYFQFEPSDDFDDTEGLDLFDSLGAEIPVNGKIRILIYCSALWGATEDTYIHSCNFSLIQYVAGTYDKVTGDQHKVERVADDNNSVDDEVYVRNAPSPVFKGALKRWDGSKWVAAGRFWNAAVFTTPPDETYLHPFGYIQIFNVWNQIRLLNRIFRGSINGIESDSTDVNDKSDLPTIFHSFYFRDTDEHTNDKKFMLLNYDIDLFKCEFASASFKEVHDEVIGKDYADPYEFKYLTR